MPKVQGTHESVSRPKSKVFTEVFDRKIEELLSILADVDARYEQDRIALEKWEGPVAAKARLQQHLEDRHRREREPYILELADIHQRRMSLTLFRSVH